mgnify:FL=1
MSSFSNGNKYNIKNKANNTENIFGDSCENTLDCLFSCLCGCDCEGKKKCTRCVNLVQDPSFESYSFEWITFNTSLTDTNVYEGAVQMELGPGTATLYQEVSLRGVNECPPLFSFGAFASTNAAGQENSSTLIAEIIWLDENFNFIGLGLRMMKPAGRLNNFSRITFVSQTDVVPKNAAYARVTFTKGVGFAQEDDLIYIDYVILAPMAYREIKNGGFEANLNNWVAESENLVAFVSAYDESLVDSGHAVTNFNGSRYQDIYIRHLPQKTPFLLSFGVEGQGQVSLGVLVEWLNQSGKEIGTGLMASIPNETINNQQNYLTYVFVTTPPTFGTRIIFDVDIPNDQNSLRLDQILFIPIFRKNLVLNPSFEINGLDN